MRFILEKLLTSNLNSKNKELILIYDGFEQIITNPFTHQLFYILKKNFKIKLIQLNKIIKKEPKFKNKQFVLVISRLRNWKFLPGVSKNFFLNNHVFFYDQDPWEAYHDYGTCKGIYELINQKILPEAFLITSEWWSNFIKKNCNVPAEFVKMGILSKYCHHRIPYRKKTYEVGFQGLVHKYRQNFFSKLQENGINLEILSREPFFKFLNSVQKIKIFICSSKHGLQMNGKSHPYHGLWGTALTVAGRGCFVIRDYDLAYEGYNIKELPAISTFKNNQEALQLIRNILDRSDEENDKIIMETVNKLKNRNDWQSLPDYIKNNIKNC